MHAPPAFFEALYADCEGFVELRVIDPTGNAAPTVAKVPVAEAAAKVQALSRTYPEQNVYMGVVARRARGAAGDRHNLSQTRAIAWADLENTVPEVAAFDIEEASLPPASLMVSSGNGVHAYWLGEPYSVETPEAQAALVARNRHVAAQLAAIGAQPDAGATDAPRILRPPGTTNVPTPKKAAAGREPKPVGLAHVSAKRYALGDFKVPALETPVAPTSSSVGPSGPSLSTAEVQALLQATPAEIFDVCSRQEFRDWVVFPLHAACAGDAEALELLIGWAATDLWPSEAESITQLWTTAKANRAGGRDLGSFMWAREERGCEPWHPPAAPTDFPELAEGEGEPQGPIQAAAPAPVDLGIDTELCLFDPEELADRPWALRDVWLRNELNLIVGAGGSAKSTYLLHRLLSAATGTRWAGCQPERALRVLYVSAEDNRAEVRKRLSVAARKMGVSLEEASRQFHFLTRDSLALVRKDDKWSATTLTPLYHSLFQATREYDIIAFDPVAELHSGLDESSNSDWGYLAAALRHMARASGIAIVAVAHAVKGGKGESAYELRGGGSFVDKARVVQNVAFATKDDLKDTGLDASKRYVRVSTTKVNVGANSLLLFEPVAMAVNTRGRDTALALVPVEGGETTAGPEVDFNGAPTEADMDAALIALAELDEKAAGSNGINPDLQGTGRSQARRKTPGLDDVADVARLPLQKVRAALDECVTRGWVDVSVLTGKHKGTRWRAIRAAVQEALARQHAGRARLGWVPDEETAL